MLLATFAMHDMVLLIIKIVSLLYWFIFNQDKRTFFPAAKVTVQPPIGCTIALFKVRHPFLNHINEPSNGCNNGTYNNDQDPSLRCVVCFE
jgi:hypothetical protein